MLHHNTLLLVVGIAAMAEHSSCSTVVDSGTAVAVVVVADTTVDAVSGVAEGAAALRPTPLPGPASRWRGLPESLPKIVRSGSSG
jgi:hypothetical protein